MNAYIPTCEKQYGGENFIEYFTMLSCVLCHGLMHKEEVIPHIPLIEIMEVKE